MIYVIGTPGSTVVKIGYTAGKPADRLSALQIGNPQPLAALWNCEGDKVLENHLHATFHEYRIRGEWFDLEPLGDPVDAVRTAVNAAPATLLRAPRFRSPAVRAVPPAAPRLPVVPLLASVEFQTSDPAWDRRFPPARRSNVVLTPGSHAPKPGCIRSWGGKCRRPAETTCDC